jgi:hypothetical protein
LQDSSIKNAMETNRIIDECVKAFDDETEAADGDSTGDSEDQTRERES